MKLVLAAGQIRVMLGSSSEDIRLTGELEITGQGKMPLQEREFNSPVEIE